MHAVSLTMKYGILCLGATVVALSAVGCVTRSPDRVPIQAAGVPPSKAISRSLVQEEVPPPPTPVSESARPAFVPPPAPVPTPAPRPPAPPARRVAAYLPHGCIVAEISDRELLVKTSTATRAPSLYEESISLSRLRGQLKSRPGIPKGTVDQSSLKDGTATIVFTAPLPPAEAAGVITSALSLDAVQRVRAVLAP